MINTSKCLRGRLKRWDFLVCMSDVREVPRRLAAHENDIYYSGVIVTVVASQITCVSTVCSSVCSGADQRKHQSSVSLAFMRGIHRWPVDSPHKGPVTRKMFPFNDVIMKSQEALSVLPPCVFSSEGQWCDTLIMLCVCVCKLDGLPLHCSDVT